MSYEDDVLHVDKYEIILQGDTITLDGFDQACPKYPSQIYSVSVTSIRS